MAIKERTRYQASWGDWYVQVEVDGQVIEFRFDHFPTSEEVDDMTNQYIAQLEEMKATTIELEAEDGEII